MQRDAKVVGSAVVLADAAATAHLAQALAPALQAGDLLLLHGPLGAGKTTLVRELVAARGGDPALVHSPTFSLVHQYALGGDAAVPLYHLDAYRLSGPEEWDTLGIEDELLTTITCIEWPERLAAALPSHLPRWSLSLDHDGQGGRLARVQAPRPWTPPTFAQLQPCPELKP